MIGQLITQTSLYRLLQNGANAVASLSPQVTRASQVSGDAHAKNDRMHGIRRFYRDLFSELRAETSQDDASPEPPLGPI